MPTAKHGLSKAARRERLHLTHFIARAMALPWPQSHLHVTQEKLTTGTSASLVPLQGQRNEDAFTIAGG